MNFVFIGLGYVGLVNQIIIASSKNNTIGYDVDKQKIANLRHGQIYINEPHLDDLFKENKLKLEFTDSIKDAVRGNSVFFICVDTPQDKSGKPNLTHFYSALDGIIKNATNDGTIIIRSTVPVGTNKAVCEYLSANSTYHFDVISFPEFLTQGNAVANELEPDRVIFGGNKEVIKTVLGLAINFYLKRKIPVMITTPENAELIKYASNCFLAMKISYINNIARICDKVGADIERVSLGMCLDKRIGSAMGKASLGYGGSCFPKDTNGFLWTCEDIDEPLDLVKATIESNDKQIKYFIKKIKTKVNNFSTKTVALLGLAFKGGTNDIRNSPALDILNELNYRKCRVKIYDPQIKELPKKLVKDTVSLSNDIIDALTDADFAIICNDNEEFKKLTSDDFISHMKKPLVFDGKNLFGLDKLPGVTYVSIGRKDSIK